MHVTLNELLLPIFQRWVLGLAVHCKTRLRPCYFTYCISKHVSLHRQNINPIQAREAHKISDIMTHSISDSVNQLRCTTPAPSSKSTSFAEEQRAIKSLPNFTWKINQTARDISVNGNSFLIQWRFNLVNIPMDSWRKVSTNNALDSRDENAVGGNFSAYSVSGRDGTGVREWATVIGRVKRDAFMEIKRRRVSVVGGRQLQ